MDEYLGFPIELAGNAAHDNKKTMQDHPQSLAVRNDEELLSHSEYLRSIKS